MKKNLSKRELINQLRKEKNENNIIRLLEENKKETYEDKNEDILDVIIKNKFGENITKN